MFKKILVIALNFCSVLLAQNTEHFEDIKNAQLILKNKISSIKTYAWQTDLKDSAKTEETIVSSAEVSNSKTETVIKTIRFHPTQRLKIIGEQEEHYNKNLQLTKATDEENGYSSITTFQYNQDDKLIKEINIWSIDYVKYHDTTIYQYGSYLNLVRSEIRNEPGKTAVDSFFYEGLFLIRKVHHMEVDTNPAISFEEEHITDYVYQDDLLMKSTTSFYYNNNTRTDSMFYENGTLVRKKSWECESPKFCGTVIDYYYNNEGSATKIVADLYPEGVRFEYFNEYDDRGLLTMSIVINHSVGKKFYKKYVYK